MTLMSRIAGSLGVLCRSGEPVRDETEDGRTRGADADRYGLAEDPEIRREGPASDETASRLLASLPHAAPAGKLLPTPRGFVWTMPATSILGEMTARSPSPGLIVSEPFRLPGTPEASIWRLAVVPAEHASDAASVYLAADSLGHAVCAQVDVAFSLATRHPAGHEVSLALAHSFQEMDSASMWGVQDMLFAEDLDSLSGTGDGTVKITLSVTSAVLTTPPGPAGKLTGVVIGQHRGRKVRLLSERPRIVLIDGFLSRDECHDMRRTASPHLQRSRVSSGTETQSRTSRGCFFTGKLESLDAVMSVEARIGELLGDPALLRDRDGETPLRRPLVKTEALQAVHYTKGQEYKEHYDNRAGSVHMRAATVLIYANGDCAAGGGTWFPRAEPLVPRGRACSDSRGVRVIPNEGRLIVFWSMDTDGTEDPASLHAAEPVRSGQKWIVTRWLREQP